MPKETGNILNKQIQKDAFKKEDVGVVASGGGSAVVTKRIKEDKVTKTPESVLGQEDRDKLVLEHIPMVKFIARGVVKHIPEHSMELDDLISAGTIGLIDAAKKYDPSKGDVFSSYAKYRIRGAINDSLRQNDWASRDMRKKYKQVEAATIDLENKLHRPPTEEEVASVLGRTVAQLRENITYMQNGGTIISGSTLYNKENDGMDLNSIIQENYSDKDKTPEALVQEDQIRSLLAKAIETLNEREKKILLLYYTQEMPMKKIGKVLGINESRVSQIHRLILEKLNNFFIEKGIKSSSGSGLEVLLKSSQTAKETN